MFYRRYGKRCFDFLTAALLLVILSPVFLALSLLVWASMGWPVLFAQQRPGREGRIFILRKFRTMTDARDSQGRLLPDEQRVTALGRFLRSTSLDELPELWNVLRGEMSLVGPRPLLPRYTPYFRPEERKRFQVLPGITGLAQISGRNNLGWDERFAADVQYVEQLSASLDARILLLTALNVIRRANVQAVPSLTLPDLDKERKAAE
ncbi:MAG TPA: sugar transferase [Acidobacteriota bacterium]|nr:sugar transferase [Acidobacteriota bacterium]